MSLTIEEKIKAISDYCQTRKSCNDCPLRVYGAYECIDSIESFADLKKEFSDEFAEKLLNNQYEAIPFNFAENEFNAKNVRELVERNKLEQLEQAKAHEKEVIQSYIMECAEKHGHTGCDMIIQFTETKKWLEELGFKLKIKRQDVTGRDIYRIEW